MAEKEEELWGRRRERDTEEVKMKFSSKIVYVLRINDLGGGGVISAVFHLLAHLNTYLLQLAKTCIQVLVTELCICSLVVQ